MGVELIKDQKGKNHLVFSKDISKEDLIMGEKIDDYKILQVLGEGSFGYVAKAKSRLNHKIYAIKQLNFSSSQKKKEIDFVENEVAILKNLDHPLITKYYKSFKEGDCLYIVMEFMDNGDLGKLIKGHKTLNKPIEEERLWNIFIQALQSLEFVHSKKLIHRDIKPENLFISNDGTIKLGDFGVAANYKDKNTKNEEKKEKKNKNQNKQEVNMNDLSGHIGVVNCQGTVVGTAPFMSPEMIKNIEYDLTSDVYSMGCTFFEAMFWTYPRIPAMDIQGLIEGKNVLKLIDMKIKNNKDVYSKELVDLVYKMIELKKEKRPDSTTILNLFIAEYNKKYSKSSNIGSVLCCLYSYPEIIQYFKNQINEKSIYSISNSISYAFLYGLNSLLNNNLNIKNKEDWKSSLFKIRTILTNHNSIYQENNEIDPRFFLSFLLGRIHKELNQRKGSYQNPFTSLFSGEMNEQQYKAMNSINYSKKEDSYNYFINNFNENNNSIISNNFYGNMKTKTVCSICKLTTYSFTAFNFVTFNLDLVQKYLVKHNYQNLMNQLNIYHCFMIQNDTLININNFSRFCRNCQQNQEHTERKQFYTFPRNLIICLDRGADFSNKTKVFYNEILDLKNCYDNPNSFNCYMLKGIVKRMDIGDKEHYISIYYDFTQKSWIVRDDSQIQKINSPFEHKQGFEVMIFYEALINNNNQMNNNVNMNNNMANPLNSNMNINLQNNFGMNNMNQNQNLNNNMSQFGNNMNMNNMNNGMNMTNVMNNNMTIMSNNNMNRANFGNNNMNMNNFNNMQSGMFNNNMNVNNMNYNYNRNFNN